MNSGNGYTCGSCGQWVYSGLAHMCAGVAQAVAPPIMLGQCRAPYIPLTPDAVRLIVREELERALKGLQVTSTSEPT